MDYYDEIKKELDENPKAKAEFDALEVPAFNEFWDKNRNLLEKPEQEIKIKRYPRYLLRIISVAASILIFVGTGLGLGLYFGFRPGDGPANENRYEDNIITPRDCKDYEILEIENNYLTDFSILEDKSYRVGDHDETHESVYFLITGIYDNGVQYREIKLRIIIQTKYEITDEAKYITERKENIGGYQISVLDEGYEEPFFRYKLGFSADNIRYYIEYNTMDENDYADFLTEFIR